VKVSIPQSVWWMRMISSVPSSRWLMASDLVVGDHAARVADDVRLTFGEAEDAVDVEPGVHACHHGDALGGRQREPAGEALGVAGVVGKQFVGGGHAHIVTGAWPRGNSGSGPCP
jgi:hypothetical protein